MENADRHFWGLILAGGEGKRLQGFIKSRYGHDQPKQYCAFTGTRSMLRHTVDRVQWLLPRERLLTIINCHHLKYAEEHLSDQLPQNIIVQPYCRETAAGILLPLLHIVHRDPEAVVGLFPSDHFIVEERRFMEFAGRAFEFARAYPRLLVLLGIDPQFPETGYGWIEKEMRIMWNDDTLLYRVKKFWEKPEKNTARTLQSKKCLWNTFVTIGRAKTLLTHFRALMPKLFQQFRKIDAVLGSSEEEKVVEKVFASLPTVNFSCGLLERIPEHLCVMKVTGIHWSDWGDPNRIRYDVSRFGSIFHEGVLM